MTTVQNSVRQSVAIHTHAIPNRPPPTQTPAYQNPITTAMKIALQKGLPEKKKTHRELLAERAMVRTTWVRISAFN